MKNKATIFKRLSARVLALLMAGSLAACGGTADNAASETAAASTAAASTSDSGEKVLKIGELWAIDGIDPVSDGTLIKEKAAVTEVLVEVNDQFELQPAFAVLGTLGNGIGHQIIALSAVRWAHYARLVRVETLTVVHSEYLMAAKAMGNSRIRIIWRYIIPNIIGQVIVIATLSIGPVILAGAALSYLGLGAQIPSPEWGLMINGGKDYIRQAPWMTLAPGLAAVFTVFSFNLLGEGIGDLIDPRLKEKAEVD